MSGTRDLLASLLPAVVGAVVVTVYLLLVLSVESQAGITVLLVAGAITIIDRKSVV